MRTTISLLKDRVATVCDLSEELEDRGLPLVKYDNFEIKNARPLQQYSTVQVVLGETDCTSVTEISAARGNREVRFFLEGLIFALRSTISAIDEKKRGE